VVEKTLVAHLRNIDDARIWTSKVPIVIDLVPIEWLPFANHQIGCHIEPEMVWPLHPMISNESCLQVLKNDALSANQLCIPIEIVRQWASDGIFCHGVLRRDANAKH
jgi:hypothetical protein